MFGSALVPFVLHGIVKINKLPALAYTIQYNIFIPIRVPQGAITNIHS